MAKFHSSHLKSRQPRIFYILALSGLFVSALAEAAPIEMLAWNVTGRDINNNPTNQNLAETIFNNEDADVLLISETSRGSDEIADMLEDDYDLIVASDGQEIWLRDDPRFSVSNAYGEWTVPFDNRTQNGVWAVVNDSQSSEPLHLYNVHLPIPDTFGGRVDDNPAVSNEDQQEGICNIIQQMESDTSAGRVIIGGDFNDISIPAGERIIEFLEGTGTLNAGFCSQTNIDMTEHAEVDVTHILGTGNPQDYSNAVEVSASSVGFGQHGYVSVTVDLDDAQ